MPFVHVQNSPADEHLCLWWPDFISNGIVHTWHCIWSKSMARRLRVNSIRPPIHPRHYRVNYIPHRCSPADMGKLNPLLSGWLSMEVVTDAMLSGMHFVERVCVYRPSSFWQERSSIRSPKQISDWFPKVWHHNQTAHADLDTNRYAKLILSTAEFLSIIIHAMPPGLFSGVFSVLTLAFYIALPTTQIFAIFGLAIARLYTNVGLSIVQLMIWLALTCYPRP